LLFIVRITDFGATEIGATEFWCVTKSDSELWNIAKIRFTSVKRFFVPTKTKSLLDAILFNGRFAPLYIVLDHRTTQEVDGDDSPPSKRTRRRSGAVKQEVPDDDARGSRDNPKIISRRNTTWIPKAGSMPHTDADSTISGEEEHPTAPAPPKKKRRTATEVEKEKARREQVREKKQKKRRQKRTPAPRHPRDRRAKFPIP
jgi:hypothetical protein